MPRTGEREKERKEGRLALKEKRKKIGENGRKDGVDGRKSFLSGKPCRRNSRINKNGSTTPVKRGCFISQG